jgi:hypothetical protein
VNVQRRVKSFHVTSQKLPCYEALCIEADYELVTTVIFMGRQYQSYKI